VVRPVIPGTWHVLLYHLVLGFEVIYSATSETEFLRFGSTAHILVSIGVGTGIFTAQAIHLPRSQGALISIPRGSLGPLSGWVGRIDRIVFLEAGANVVGSGAGRVARTTRKSVAYTETGTSLPQGTLHSVGEVGGSSFAN